MGVAVEDPTLREARVVAQLWERWFLHFDLPLHTLGVPHGTLYVMSTLMESVHGGGGRRDRTLYADFPPPLFAGFQPGSAGPWAPKAP